MRYALKFSVLRLNIVYRIQCYSSRAKGTQIVWSVDSGQLKGTKFK